MLFPDLALLEGSGIGRGVGSGMGISVGSGIGIALALFPSIPPSLHSVRVVASLSHILLEDRLVPASLLDGWGRKTLCPALSAASHASSYQAITLPILFLFSARSTSSSQIALSTSATA